MTNFVISHTDLSSLTDEELWQELSEWWWRGQSLHDLVFDAYEGEEDNPLLGRIGDAFSGLADTALERHVEVAVELGARDLAPAGQDISDEEVARRWPRWAEYESQRIAGLYPDEAYEQARQLRKFLRTTGLDLLLGVSVEVDPRPDSDSNIRLMLPPLSAFTTVLQETAEGQPG